MIAILIEGKNILFKIKCNYDFTIILLDKTILF